MIEIDGITKENWKEYINFRYTNKEQSSYRTSAMQLMNRKLKDTFAGLKADKKDKRDIGKLFYFFKYGRAVTLDISDTEIISHGTRRHSNNFECVHASQIRRCQGRTGADESKGAVKKGDGIGGYGECQERIEKGKCGIKLGGKNRVAVRVVKFTAICTSFSYQNKKKYAKIYRDRVLRENG